MTQEPLSVAAGREVSIHDSVEAHSGAVWSVRASEALLLSASTDCALKLWDLRAPVRMHAPRRRAGRLTPF